VYIGFFEWRIYWVEWNTRNAKPAKKSRDDNKPATGLNVNPVQSKNRLLAFEKCDIRFSIIGLFFINSIF